MNSHQSGLEAFKQGDYEAAASLFQDALKEQETAERWNDWATAQMSLGRIGAAEQGYRRAIELDPQHREAATNLGLLLAASGRPTDAIPLLKRCLPELDTSAHQKVAKVLEDCRRVVPPDPPLFPPHRITVQEIANALHAARRRFPKRKIIVLQDNDLRDGEVTRTDECTLFDCRRLGMDQFAKCDFFNSVFVYACSWHFHGAPFIKYIIARGGRFMPVWNNGPALYVDQNPVARRVLEAEWITQRQEQFAKWDCGPGDFINLCQALEITRHTPGVFLEIGCFRGSSGSVAMHYMKEAGIYREAYFLMYLTGLSEAALLSPDTVWLGSHSTEGPALVSERLKRQEQPELGLKVTVRRHNIVEEDLPGDFPAIAVANIDVDLYEAVLAALTKVAPRMAPGGIMVVEDPGHTPQLVGARVALDEFLAGSAASSFLPVYMESGQTFLIRKPSRLP